jgi:hypothetical protein
MSGPDLVCGSPGCTLELEASVFALLFMRVSHAWCCATLIRRRHNLFRPRLGCCKGYGVANGLELA